MSQVLRVSKAQWAAVALSTVAVVWMLAPTFPMTWGISPTETLVTWHSWADPLALGYALFSPVVLAAAVVAAVVGWAGALRRRATFAPMVCCVIAVGLAVLLFLLIGVHVLPIIPVVLLLLSGLLHWRAVSERGGTDAALGASGG